MKIQNIKDKMQKFLITSLLTVCYLLLPTITLAYYTPESVSTTRIDKTYAPPTTVNSKSQVSDKPADFWYIWWTGIGNFAKFTVSNTLQGGYFGRPPSCEYPFEGTPEQASESAQGGGPAYRGLTGEYPAGSGQHYVWAAGMWVGALYPAKIKATIDTTTGDTTRIDTTWERRVSKGAYYSDMGGMAIPELTDAGEVGDISFLGLTFSTQIIPIDHGFEHGGEYVFSQVTSSKEDYQAFWPFADTLINARRTDPATHVHTDLGDIISGEDTYAVAGDWTPEQDASGIWVRDEGLYDVHPLGIRVEQRTYSWNYDYNNAYIYLNWKIRNMNSFPLDSIYLGYFMDNDIGATGAAGAQGANDDLIGFDTSSVEILPGVFRNLNLGYTYDSDGYEDNWTTVAGFVGCVLCETPNDKGLTGFQYWTRIGEFGLLVDRSGQDSLKYEALSCREPRFIVAGTDGDMRQLSCSGPYVRLLPGEEIDFTVAIVVAYTLDELKERSITALKQFELGYLGYEPPPSPKLSVIPGDDKVYLSWNGAIPENYVDKMAKVPTFEGYRVYKSTTGLVGEWDTLATFDMKSTSSETLLVKYAEGTSKAEISFEGLDANHSGLETKTYKIIFNSGHDFTIWDSTANAKVFYNSSAHTSGEGYCVMLNDTSTYSSDPGYISNALIYINGFYVKIKNGEVIPEQRGVDLAPCARDEFMIWAFASEDIGKEVGLEHNYIDESVTNGKKYYYTVTSFSRPLPEFGVESLESGKSGTQYWAIPVKQQADYEGASCGTAKLGIGDAKITATVVNPKYVIGDTYTISFFTTDTTDTLTPEYWKLTNKATNAVLLDSCSYFDMQSLPLFDGLDIKLDSFGRGVVDTETVFDSLITGWKEGDYSDWSFDITPNTGYNGAYFYDYELTISDTGSTDLKGNHAPFTLWNTDLDTAGLFWYATGDSDSLWVKNKIWIYSSIDDYPTQRAIILEVNFDATKHISPKNGDVYKIHMLNQATVLDTFEIITTSFDTKKTYTLDSVRVVPNPYYISAAWDKSTFSQKIWFQGLPSKCTIRIFNVAGLLIKTIEHNEPTFSEMRDRTEISEAGAHAWDLCSEEKKGETGLKVASGLYIYQVTAKIPGSENLIQKIGKFAIIR